MWTYVYIYLGERAGSGIQSTGQDVFDFKENARLFSKASFYTANSTVWDFHLPHIFTNACCLKLLALLEGGLRFYHVSFNVYFSYAFFPPSVSLLGEVSNYFVKIVSCWSYYWILRILDMLWTLSLLDIVGRLILFGLLTFLQILWAETLMPIIPGSLFKGGCITKEPWTIEIVFSFGEGKICLLR